MPICTRFCLGLRGLKVEERAREIITHLGSLRGQLVRFQEEFRKLGKHLEQSKGSFDSAQRQLEKFGDRLAAVETPPLLPADEEPAEKNSSHPVDQKIFTAERAETAEILIN